MMIDLEEQHNMSELYPEKFEQMQSQIDMWWNDVTNGTKLEGTSYMPVPVSGQRGNGIPR